MVSVTPCLNTPTACHFFFQDKIQALHNLTQPLVLFVTNNLIPTQHLQKSYSYKPLLRYLLSCKTHLEGSLLQKTFLIPHPQCGLVTDNSINTV